MLSPELNTHNFELKNKIWYCPIKLQDSLIINTCRRNQSLSCIFDMKTPINERKLQSIRISVGCGQAYPDMPKLGNTGSGQLSVQAG